MSMLRVLRSLRRRDEGIVLPAVIGIGIVIPLVVFTGAAISTSGATKYLTEGNSSNAMQAAYAGAADYQSRLTNNNSYWQFGATTPFTGTSTYQQGTGSNPAFGTTAGDTWATVNGSGGTESYRYEVNNSKFASTGAVQLRVTGRSGNQTRSLVATVRGTGFIDYLYFTDYESQNPALSGETQNPYWNGLCLSVHLTDPSYNANSACNPVQFRSGDLLAGPIRTNDEFTICGATFNQTVQSTAPDGVYNNASSSCAAPTFGQASATSPQPKNAGTLLLPQTNGNMAQAARSDINASPGCLYTGPTSITFNGDGTEQIVSPWSRATQISLNSDGVTYSGTMASACGSSAALKSSAGAKVSLSSNLIFVQAVSGDTANPNYWATGTYPTTTNGAIVCSKTTTNKNVSTTTYGNGLISPLSQNYPGNNEYVGPAGNTSTSSPYYCRNGDAFVSGQFNGALTIGAESNLYVVGAITYKDSTNDILGLVGQTSVSVWNPVSCSSYSGSSCSTNLGASTLLRNASGSNMTISAAIASNKGTFTVQNYAYGAQLGTLTVVGSIAQEWRGAVGVSYGGSYITGYTKNYGYDQRLKNTAPPKFLQPVTTAFSISQQVEVSPAYASTGAAS